ncbi:MAG: DUF58 domain-containing protein [Terriglobales bacterium]
MRAESAAPSTGERVGWRQSLGAGLLLGLALGCGWLAHWTPHLYPRLLLYIAAGLLALVGAGLMLTLSEQRGWTSTWRRQLEGYFAGAGIPFFTALVVLLVAAITSGNNLLYLIVSGLMAALIVSGLSAALNLTGMELRFRLPEEVFAGTPAPVYVQLSNAKRYWPAYSVTLTASAQVLGPAAPGSAASLRPVYFGYLARGASTAAASELSFSRRGRYSSAVFVLSTGFPFGLMRKRRRFQSSAQEPEMLIYPAPAAGLELPLAEVRAGTREALRRRGEGQELYRLRPHQPGDSARQVHWKASAHTGTLVVREASDENGLRLRLRLALPPELDAGRAEAALSLCAGWMLALEGSELWLEFAGENAMPNGRGLFLGVAPAARHRRAVLDYLAQVDGQRPHAPLPPLTPGLYEIQITGATGTPQ